MKSKLYIYGTGSLGEKIFHYNERDHIFNIVGFIDDNIEQDAIFCGLPVYTFEMVKQLYKPEECVIFVAIGYVKCNYYRELIFNKVRHEGYKLANYISPYAICFNNVILGENIFICDNVFVGHGSQLENGVIIYENSVLSHDITICKFTFISICVAFGGHAKVENNCFVGLHSTVRDSVVIGAYSIIGSGTNVIKSTPEYSVTVGNPGVPTIKDTINISI